MKFGIDWKAWLFGVEWYGRRGWYLSFGPFYVEIMSAVHGRKGMK